MTSGGFPMFTPCPRHGTEVYTLDSSACAPRGNGKTRANQGANQGAPVEQWVDHGLINHRLHGLIMLVLWFSVVVELGMWCSPSGIAGAKEVQGPVFHHGGLRIMRREWGADLDNSWQLNPCIHRALWNVVRCHVSSLSCSVGHYSICCITMNHSKTQVTIINQVY